MLQSNSSMKPALGNHSAPVPQTIPPVAENPEADLVVIVQLGQVRIVEGDQFAWLYPDVLGGGSSEIVRSLPVTS